MVQSGPHRFQRQGVFQADVREYYRLENLWSEAPREEIRPVDPASGAPFGDGSEEG